MKGLVFAGCSFTWGQGLEYYSDLNDKKFAASAQLKLVNEEVESIANIKTTDNDMQTQSLQNIITDSVDKKKAAAQKKDLEDKKANFYRIVEEIFGDKSPHQVSVS
jgi:hypothetical protein